MLESSVSPKKGDLTDSAMRLLATCGIVGPIFFATVVIVLGFIQPGYNHVSQAISELGGAGAPHAAIQDINFVVTGVLFFAFAFGLHRGISGGKGSKVGPSLVAMSALAAFIGGGVFRCDPGCNFVTPTGILHDLLGLTGFAALSAGTLILSRRLKTDGQWHGHEFYSLVTGLLMIVFLVGFVLSSGFLPAYRGLIQRLLAGTFLLWIEVMAIRLFQISSRLQQAVA